jgi:nitroimidazol reductase NimA-like FMN-containing flavoprotein (pyridoxamine 5'-phosphate oxidase superfamily)
MMNMRKLNSEEIDKFIPDSKIPIRIAFMKSTHLPSVISLWYVCKDGKIYCATQKTAKIVSYLQKNPVSGFEIAADKPPYKGIRGEGTVQILNETGACILDLLIDKYLGEKESALTKFLRNNSKTEVAIEITPQKVIHYDYSKRMRGA